MPSAKNIEAVKQLTEKINASKTIVFMNYKGVPAAQDNELRKVVQSQEGLEYFVAKNRLFKIALKDAGVESDGVEEALKGSTSFVLSYEDELLAPKMTKQFKDKNSVFELKGGVFEKQFVNASTVEELSNIPSKEVLIAQLVSQLQAPIQKLHNVLKGNLTKVATVLKNISEKK